MTGASLFVSAGDTSGDFHAAALVRALRETMAVGGLLSDLVAVIASLDPVMGEVDR